jgi:hypothetical protein
MKNLLKIKIVCVCVLSLFCVNEIYSQWTYSAPFLYPTAAGSQVGIGTTTPSQYLQVVGGNIDVNTANQSYMISGFQVLWHNGDITSLYGGVNAGGGTALTTTLGNANTFVGFNTGYNNIAGGICNSFFGNSAGFNNTTGYFNSFLGDSAGWSNKTGFSNTYVGHVAGFTDNGSQFNTFLGDSSGYNNNGTVLCVPPFDNIGILNTFAGASSGVNNICGEDNTFIGYQAGHENTVDSWSTYIGYRAGYWGGTWSDGGGDRNVFVGMEAGFGVNNIYDHGDNTFIGTQSGKYINGGGLNSFLGLESGFSINNGADNTILGADAGFNIINGFGNTFSGVNCGEQNDYSSYNSFYGYQAGNTHYSLTTNINNNSYNTYVGADAQSTVNGYQNTLEHSVAIGANAIVNDNYMMELGENGSQSQPMKVGIGLSADTWTSFYNPNGGPRSALEINAGPGFVPPVFNAVGASGLQFRGLNAYCQPVANPSCDGTIGPLGCTVLSVDERGNVILVAENGGGGTGIGYCPPFGIGLSLLSYDGGYSLGTNNFYFDGNYSGSSQQNNVIIGNTCALSPIKGKLDVLQSSGDVNTIGIYVENDDLTGTGGLCALSTGPVIGIKSFIPFSPYNLFSIAGWFEADGPAAVQEYAIFVPQGGGGVSIGFDYCSTTPGNLLQVNGSVSSTTPTFIVGSDQALKKDTSNYTDGLNLIRHVRPINYKYNGLAGFDTTGSHVGVFAQEMQTIAPYTVDSFKARLHPNDANLTTLLNFNTTPLIYASINAIKQLDSTNQSQQNLINNLNSTVNSLQNQINDLTTQINNCCNNGSRTSNKGDNNNGGNGNNVNIQTMDLSSVGSDILLFQNFPDPFKGTTKIKYVIPSNANVTTAQIVFFDEYGNKLSSYIIQDRGIGELELTTENLASGVYSYSLIIDNQVFGTKRMVKTK